MFLCVRLHPSEHVLAGGALGLADQEVAVLRGDRISILNVLFKTDSIAYEY